MEAGVPGVLVAVGVVVSSVDGGGAGAVETIGVVVGELGFRVFAFVTAGDKAWIVALVDTADGTGVVALVTTSVVGENDAAAVVPTVIRTTTSSVVSTGSAAVVVLVWKPTTTAAIPAVAALTSSSFAHCR